MKGICRRSLSDVGYTRLSIPLFYQKQVIDFPILKDPVMDVNIINLS